VIPYYYVRGSCKPRATSADLHTLTSRETQTVEAITADDVTATVVVAAAVSAAMNVYVGFASSLEIGCLNLIAMAGKVNANIIVCSVTIHFDP
jgi:hypothetical protein